MKSLRSILTRLGFLLFSLSSYAVVMPYVLNSGALSSGRTSVLCCHAITSVGSFLRILLYIPTLRRVILDLVIRGAMGLVCLRHSEVLYTKSCRKKRRAHGKSMRDSERSRQEGTCQQSNSVLVQLIPSPTATTSNLTSVPVPKLRVSWKASPESDCSELPAHLRNGKVFQIMANLRLHQWYSNDPRLQRLLPRTRAALQETTARNPPAFLSSSFV